MFAVPPQFTAQIAAQRRAQLEQRARLHDLARSAGFGSAGSPKGTATPCARRTVRDTLRLFVERTSREVPRELVPNRAGR